MIATHGVAAAGVVAVEAASRPGHQVIRLVVDAAVGVSGAIGTGFAGVVVDHVEPDIDAVGVEGIDHGAEFLDGAAFGFVGGVAFVRGEEVEGHVAPVTAFFVIALVDGHQFHGGDAEAFEMKWIFR